MSHPTTDPIDHARLISLAAASHLLRGRGGKAPSIHSMRRWAHPQRGWTAPSGEKVFLRSVKVGGEILVLPEWVEDFVQARIAAGLRHIEYKQQRVAAVQTNRQRVLSERETQEILERMRGAGRGRRAK